MRASTASRILCGAWLAIAAQHYAAAQASNPAAQQRARQWYEYYDEGVRAVQQQRWQPAVDNLLAAQKARAQQSRRVAFYGDRIDAYVPDYYLGLAYTGLGRFAEADAAFQRVAAQKLVVAGDSTFPTFQTQAARARTEAAAAAARTQETPVQTASNPPAGAGAGAVPASPAQTAAPPPAQSPVQIPESTVAAGETKAPEPVAPLPGAATPPPVQGTTPRNPAPILPGLRVPSVLRMPETAARAALAQAGLAIGARSSAASSAAAGTVIAQSPQPGSIVQAGTRVDLRLSAAPTAVRATERDGIAAFYGGDYAAAAQILEVVVASDGKAGPSPTARARLFLASSVAAQVLVGERDRMDLESARAQLARVGALAQFAADRRLISPRILAALGAQP